MNVTAEPLRVACIGMGWWSDVLADAIQRSGKLKIVACYSRSGDKRNPGVLYLHVEPGESMVGAGFWHPEPERLARLRRAILADADAFLRLAVQLERADHPVSTDERLSRPPRGFEAAKGTPAAEFVGFKSFTVHAALADAEMQSPAVVDRIVGFAHTVMPLLEWGWAAIDDAPPAPVTIRGPARPLPKPDF